MVVLDKSQFKTGLIPVGATVNLREKTPSVAVLLRRYALDRRNCGLFHLHHGPPSLRPPGLERRSSCQKPTLGATPASEPGARKLLEGPGEMRERQRAVSRNPMLFLRAH